MKKARQEKNTDERITGIQMKRPKSQRRDVEAITEVEEREVGTCGICETQEASSRGRHWNCNCDPTKHIKVFLTETGELQTVEEQGRAGERWELLTILIESGASESVAPKGH